jgi:hypothetical protein
MNDDLKPGPLATSITPQRAFMMAELIALRLRDKSMSEAARLTADAIAEQIHALAGSWETAEQYALQPDDGDDS